MPSIFATYGDEVLFYCVYSAWFILEVSLTWLMPVLRSRGRGRIRVVERRSRALLLLSTFIILFLAFFFSYFSLYTGIGLLPAWLFAPGMALMMMGIAFREWAVVTLGRYFYPRVAIQEGHRVITDGPYGLVRHPAYGGTLIIMAGLSIALRSAVSLAAALAIIYPILWARARREEQLLVQELGEEYLAYSRRVKRRFVPFLVRRPAGGNQNRSPSTSLTSTQ
ncbi:MAG: methyltransferase family protein [Conexivisphaera sp.]